MDKNEYTAHPNVWDTMKMILRSKFIKLNAYKKKLERSPTSNLTTHLISRILSPKRDVSNKTLPSGLREPCRREGRKSVRTMVGGGHQTPRHLDPTELERIITHRDCRSIQRVCRGLLQMWS